MARLVARDRAGQLTAGLGARCASFVRGFARAVAVAGAWPVADLLRRPARVVACWYALQGKAPQRWLLSRV